MEINVLLELPLHDQTFLNPHLIDAVNAAEITHAEAEDKGRKRDREVTKKTNHI